MTDPLENKPDSGTTSYEVGYRKPPRSSQFPPKTSGNPSGRPKGARGLKAELMAEMDERVTVTANGKPKRMNMLRVIIKALAAQAAKGNVAAADKLLSLLIQAHGFEDQRRTLKSLNDTDLAILDRALGNSAPAEKNEAPMAIGEASDD